jgi:polar amino acid transport system permease protein
MLDRLIAHAPAFFTLPNARFLGLALLNTLTLTLVGCVTGLIAGAAIAVLRRARGWPVLPLRVVAVLYVEVFRRVPFLVTLLLVFYATQLAGLNAPLFVIAAGSISLIATAYISEIVRAGLDSVHRAQWESAIVANFSTWQTLRLVVFPQAWKVILPPALGFFLLFLKDSALASQIGVVELTFAGKALNNRGFPPVLSLGAVLILYFVLSWPLTVLGRRLEARLARPRYR